MDMQTFVVSLYSRPKDKTGGACVHHEGGFIKWELGISPTSSENPSQEAGHTPWP